MKSLKVVYTGGMATILVACDDCGHQITINAPTKGNPDLPMHKCDPYDKMRVGKFVAIGEVIKRPVLR